MSSSKIRLTVVETHPVQYHAPVYRCLQQDFGHDVTVIYGSDSSINGGLDIEFGVSVKWDTDLVSGYQPVFLTSIKDQAWRPSIARGYSRLAKAIQASDPDAVLLVGYAHRLYLNAFAACSGRYPLLYRAEASDVAKIRNWAKSNARDILLRGLYSRMAGILYIGKNALTHFKRLGVPNCRLYRSPYCVDTTSFQPASREAQCRTAVRAELGIPENTIVLMFSGKLSERKGPEHIIQAVRSMPDHEREQITCLFVGDGKLSDRLYSYAAEWPTVKIRLVGFKNQSTISQYYYAADCLVLPSLFSETWGLVVNDALWHGRPAVVSSAVGCALDLIVPGITGEVFEAGSVEGLRHAITRARAWISNPEHHESCRAAVADYSVFDAASGLDRALVSILN